jgi:hypothetical protein
MRWYNDGQLEGTTIADTTLEQWQKGCHSDCGLCTRRWNDGAIVIAVAAVDRWGMRHCNDGAIMMGNKTLQQWRTQPSGMPIDSYKPRSESINWSVMPYSSSQGVHPRPKQNIRRLSRTENYRIFGVKQKLLHP